MTVVPAIEDAYPPSARRFGSRSTVGTVLMLAPAILFLVGFYVLPLMWTVRLSFPTWEDGLANYSRFLFDPYYLRVTLNTFVLSTVVSLLSLVLGYPIAYYLVRKAKRSSGLIVFLLIAPLLTSIVMRTYGWRVLFSRRGLVNETFQAIGLTDRPLAILDNPVSAVIGLVHVLVPFMVLAIAASLQSVSRSLEESSRVLGSSAAGTFFRITLPLTYDGIATGTILVFMLASGSFVTLLYLGGSISTLPLLIYQQFQTTLDFPFAAAMSNILLVMAVACLALQLSLIKRRG